MSFLGSGAVCGSLMYLNVKLVDGEQLVGLGLVHGVQVTFTPGVV